MHKAHKSHRQSQRQICLRTQCYWETSVPFLMAFLAILVKKNISYCLRLLLLAMVALDCVPLTALLVARDCYIHFIHLLQLHQYVLKHQMHKYMTRYDLFVSFYFFPPSSRLFSKYKLRGHEPPLCMKQIDQDPSGGHGATAQCKTFMNL